MWPWRVVRDTVMIKRLSTLKRKGPCSRSCTVSIAAEWRLLWFQWKKTPRHTHSTRRIYDCWTTPGAGPGSTELLALIIHQELNNECTLISRTGDLNALGTRSQLDLPRTVFLLYHTQAWPYYASWATKSIIYYEDDAGSFHRAQVMNFFWSEGIIVRYIPHWLYNRENDLEYVLPAVQPDANDKLRLPTLRDASLVYL